MMGLGESGRSVECGESGPVEARFHATGDVFDPGTNRRMRVLLDPATAERRYVAEG
jgi:hypothetical protein